ncbi:hypothetical protein GCM10009855_22850 [Gordonia cholesterolivorans]|uniref:Uncharacterized protein n=1 Tax=Gordonia cholesterolivorans TaxID=559625 RepID=A0ABN3HJR6_9ACTN
MVSGAAPVSLSESQGARISSVVSPATTSAVTATMPKNIGFGPFTGGCCGHGPGGKGFGAYGGCAGPYRWGGPYGDGCGGCVRGGCGRGRPGAPLGYCGSDG